MGRTYTRSLIALLCVLVAGGFCASSALELWMLKKSTLPSIEALKPLDATHTWRFVQPMLARNAEQAFVESQISGLVGNSVVLQQGWKRYVEVQIARLQWELAAWFALLLGSGVMFALRTDHKSAA
jgi:hypothetical protein